MSDYDKRNSLLNVKAYIDESDNHVVFGAVGKLVLLASSESQPAGLVKLSLLMDCSYNESFSISDSDREKLESMVERSEYLRDRALALASEVLETAASLGMSMKGFANSVNEYDVLKSEIHLDETKKRIWQSTTKN